MLYFCLFFVLTVHAALVAAVVFVVAIIFSLLLLWFRQLLRFGVELVADISP